LRRTALLVGAMLTALVALSGVAWALTRAGKGADFIDGGQGNWRGKDVNYGGPGDDFIEGHLDPERHYGGLGDDYIADFIQSGNTDHFHCGRGYDTVDYNEGEDIVDADCEMLLPRQPGK
jgi:hypothetical protein